MKKKLIIAAVIIVLLITGVILYSHFVGTKGLIVKESKIVNKKLPESFNGFKVVHFSDLHYGSTINEKELKKIVKEINKYHPDIVVFTGDLLSDKKIKTEKVIGELNKIEASSGIYYVSGKNDNDKTSMILNKTNFVNMDNTSKLIYYKGSTPINIIGYGKEVTNDSEYFSILLTHNPDHHSKINNDLTLAGMTHGNQINLPLINKIIDVDGADYDDNYYQYKNHDLYISNGLGTTKYQFRLFSHPSINAYRLYNN